MAGDGRRLDRWRMVDDMKKMKIYQVEVYTAYSKLDHLCGLKDGMRKIVIKGCTKKDAMQRAGIK